MPRNIEIKARISGVEQLLPAVSAIADKGPIDIQQDDTFFVCANGRLKLRVLSAFESELIFYRRADQYGPKESFYLRSPISAPDTLRESLSLAYGQAGRVRKHRVLFLRGRTRIHLDRVEGLGDFLELEVVLQENEAADAGMLEAKALLSQLCVQDRDLVPDAYVDLMGAGDRND
jgi:predicted adenylyl cyclase CyaB